MSTKQLDTIYSTNYLSIRDQDNTIECINNNCRLINNNNNNNNTKKKVRFREDNNKKTSKDTYRSIIDTIIDYLYIFSIILLAISGILNRNSKNLIILLFITILYIFYKKWIEKIL